jgi:septum formation protein
MGGRGPTVNREARVWRGSDNGRLVLASASPTRARLLRDAGIAFQALAPAVDEASVKEAMRAAGARGIDAALTLAELKAARISATEPDAFVLGCDQLLDCAGSWFDKATDRADAARQLQALGGRVHELATAACVMQAGVRLWHHVEQPRLRMRPLDAALVEAYLDAAGEEALGCVGAYRLEGLGAQLFDRVEGDCFSILGLPLLALLGFLRGRGLAP